MSQGGGYNRGSERVDLERGKHVGKCQGVRQLIRGQNSRLELGAPRELWTSGEEFYSQVGEEGIRRAWGSLQELEAEKSQARILMDQARKVLGSQSPAPGRSWRMGSRREQPEVHTNASPECSPGTSREFS